MPIEEISVNGVWDYKIWLHDPEHILDDGAANTTEEKKMMRLFNDTTQVYRDVPVLSLTLEGKVIACRVIPINAFNHTTSRLPHPQPEKSRPGLYSGHFEFIRIGAGGMR